MNETALLAADSVMMCQARGKVLVLLILRRFPPYENMWALPGGFVEKGERLEAAARRELMEETGLTDVSLRPIGTFAEPGRDPRGRVVSAVFMGVVPAGPVDIQPTDETLEGRWWPVDELPDLAFDHDKVIELAVRCYQQVGSLHVVKN